MRIYYRPRVEMEYPDISITIGDYRFLLFSKGMQSIGAIGYKHLLGVLDQNHFDQFHVAAETNPMEGNAVIYLGRFDPRRHATLTNIPFLGYVGFFIPVASMVARVALDLTYELVPLTQSEDSALGMIPGLIQKVYPDGNIE